MRSKNNQIKHRKDKLFEFACMMLYYLIIVTCLRKLMVDFYRTEFQHSIILDNPIKFSWAIMKYGILSAVIYGALDWLLRCILPHKKKPGEGLYKLTSHETALIAIVTCIHLSIICSTYVKEYPDLKIIIFMLLSLPLGKISFISTSIVDILKECKTMLLLAKNTWPVLLFTTLYMALQFCPRNLSTSLNIITWGALLTYIFWCWYNYPNDSHNKQT